MGFLFWGQKIDDYIKPFLKINTKKKLPVIVCYKDNEKLVKNKILSNGGKIKYQYLNVKAISCEIAPLSLDKLSETPEISFISFDYKGSLCLRKAGDIVGISNAKTFNLTGKGIGIGIVDTGVFPHPDLTVQRNAIHHFTDLINDYERPYDDNGHGTFICGCIASSGYSSSGMYSGMAPDALLCVIKAFDSSGKGYMSDIIKAIDLLISEREKYNIRILCLPFEFPYFNFLKKNPLKDIILSAYTSGISIILPSGNYGPQSYTVYFPGNMKEVITVGGAFCQTKDLKNSSVSPFSGRGPTKDGLNKPDLLAPSLNITSLSSDLNYIPLLKSKKDMVNPYTVMSGTSIACAIICGISALILEKTPTITPADLKSILCLSTMSIGENRLSQGSGIFLFDKIIK